MEKKLCGLLVIVINSVIILTFYHDLNSDDQFYFRQIWRNAAGDILTQKFRIFEFPLPRNSVSSS